MLQCIIEVSGTVVLTVENFHEYIFTVIVTKTFSDFISIVVGNLEAISKCNLPTNKEIPITRNNREWFSI